jgi:hypothetical protein
MIKPSIITQIIFSPLTIWLSISTIFLLLLHKFEISIKNIGNETKSHFYKYDFKPIEYHKISFGQRSFFCNLSLSSIKRYSIIHWCNVYLHL